MANSGLLFLSPHFDDAVLSCSSYLYANPNSVVATVCSGVPRGNAPAGGWDNVSGFTSAREAVVIRQNEDRLALRELRAQQRMLGFLDSMYLTSGQIHERLHLDKSGPTELLWAVVDEIGALLDELNPTHCFFPLGIFTSDHLVTRRAALLALSSRPWCQAMVYLDIPHAFDRPPLVKAQLDWLQATESRDIKQTTDMTHKHRAIACYRSQMSALRWAFPQYWSQLFDADSEKVYEMSPVSVEACAVKLEQTSNRTRAAHFSR